jgi:hypothetical protein
MERMPAAAALVNSDEGKSAFMNEFQALAAGAKRVQQPSLFERAKAHWNERHRNHL